MNDIRSTSPKSKSPFKKALLGTPKKPLSRPLVGAAHELYKVNFGLKEDTFEFTKQQQKQKILLQQQQDKAHQTTQAVPQHLNATAKSAAVFHEIVSDAIPVKASRFRLAFMDTSTQNTMRLLKKLLPQANSELAQQQNGSSGQSINAATRALAAFSDTLYRIIQSAMYANNRAAEMHRTVSNKPYEAAADGHQRTIAEFPGYLSASSMYSNTSAQPNLKTALSELA
jgi:hypothetical protein